MRTGTDCVSCSSNSDMGNSKVKAKKRPDGVTVGFDLGGTKMYAVVFDDGWRALGSARKRIDPGRKRGHEKDHQ